MKLSQPPFIKGKNFIPNKIAIEGIPRYADSRLNPKVIGTPAWESFWNDELYKIFNGVQTGGRYISGRLYYYLNYNSMATVRGIITPDIVDLHIELLELIEFAFANQKDILVAKKRRAGISELTQKAVIDYGWRFQNGAFHGGIAAGQDIYAQDFMNKLRASEALLPPELQLKKLKDNDDELVAGYKIKKDGTTISGGTKNTLHIRTMKQNPALFKGLFLNVAIAEECGEFEHLSKFLAHTRPCLMDGSRKVGSFLVYGTGGNMLKGSKDFQELWYEAKKGNNDFIPFLITAERFHKPFYGGCKVDGEDVGVTPNLIKEHKPYELIGVEDTKAALEHILAERAEILKSKNSEKYQEHLKDYPLTEADVFRKTIVNAFDTDVMNNQMDAIMASPKKYLKCDIEWKRNDKGEPLFPPETVLKFLPDDFPEDGVCFLIHVDHLGGKNKQFEKLFCAGCLPPDEMVMTDSGLKKVQLISKDDLLINELGEYVIINDLLTHDVVDENLYTIKVSNTFRTTTFTSEHPILISEPIMDEKKRIDRKGLLFKYIKAPLVKKDHWIKAPNIYRKTNDYDINCYWSDLGIRKGFALNNPIEDPDFWWFVGLWLGDGWCDSKKFKVHASFNCEEVEYIERYEGVVRRLFDRSVSFRKRHTKCIETSFSSKQLVTFLDRYFGKYADKKIIPEWAKKINIPCKKQLVRGYMNADGGIKRDKKRDLYGTHFVSINLQMLEGIQDILFSLGHVSSLNRLRHAKQERFSSRRNTLSNVRECFELRMGHSDTLDFVRSIWDKNDPKLRRVNFDNLKKINRKRAADGCFIDESLEYIYFKVRDVEVKKYTGSVYNFNCETHTFMCHHITTHNCDGYDRDLARTSKSKGAMCVIIRRNNIKDSLQLAPVATICCRPDKKEVFYEMCVKLAVHFDLQGSVLCDIASPSVITWFQNRGLERYLAYRPKKWESENSEQTHTFGLSLNNYSKPKMLAEMQSAVDYFGDQIWFPELLNQLQNFDIAYIGSDNDLADAFGLALLQDGAEEMVPRDNKDFSLSEMYSLGGEFKTDKNGNLIEENAKPFLGGTHDHPDLWGQKDPF